MKQTVKFSISLPRDMAGWLRRKASKAGVKVSWIVRAALRPEYEGRHAK